MNKRARLIVGIILMVLGVLSLMGLYLQTGMNLWTAFGVGLGASIFTIGLPCLGTFLIWGYKEKEKVDKKEIVEKKVFSKMVKSYLKNYYKIYLVIIFIALISIGITLFFTLNLEIWVRILILSLFVFISIIPLTFCFLKRHQ